jgi:curved DNA-binding protein CbpA
LNLETHYKVLGLAPGSSLALVKKAYLREIKTWHPDRYAPDSILREQAEERTKTLTAAYAALSAVLEAREGTGAADHAQSAATADQGKTAKPTPNTRQASHRTGGQWFERIWQLLRDPWQAQPERGGPSTARRRAGKKKTEVGVRPRKASTFNDILDAARSHPGSRADAWRRLAAKRPHYQRRLRGMGPTPIDPIGPRRPISPVRPIDPIGEDD